jgi:hypothetical protein
MDTADILRMRLRAQLIEGGSEARPHDVVSHLLAMQAQDYAGALWAIGLRLRDSTLADIERAIAERTIVRTWPMRGTLHFVAAEDVRWLLPFLAPRVVGRAANRERQLGLDPVTFARSRELFEAALTGGRRLSRPQAMAMLEADGIATDGQRGYHILWRLAQEGLLVLGPMEGKQQTFALLEEWVPAEKGASILAASREEALARLAARYVVGHGPATASDLARWAGLTRREAATALDAIASTLESAEHDGERYWFAPHTAATIASASAAARDTLEPHRRPETPRVQLLPGFDEYMLGYTGRSHQLGEHLERYGSKVAANGMLAPTLIVDGRAIGTWRRTLKTRTVSFEVSEFRRLSSLERKALTTEEERFARFVGRELAP